MTDHPTNGDSRGARQSQYRLAIRLALVLVTLFIVAACIAVEMVWRDMNVPVKVADIPGPQGRTRSYELWYAKNGDLTFRPSKGNPIIYFYDYYGDVRVARTAWPDDNHVAITMNDGTKMEIRFGFDITRP